MGTRQKMGSEHVEWREIDGRRVEVVGCWDEETPEGQYGFYDLFLDGECINLGEPCWASEGKPTDEDIRAFLELQEALK
jgi:hypothetical protein